MKKSLALLILISLISFSATTRKSGTEIPSWFLGKWTGIGYQIDRQTWSINLNTSGSEILISYPSLGCSGTWSIVKIAKRKIYLEEKITEGTDKCDQGCKIVVSKMDDGKISLVYTLPSYQKKPIANAVMARK